MISDDIFYNTLCNFLEKRLSFAKNLASSGSQGSSELDGSPKRLDATKKSILRMSPMKSAQDSNKSLRGSLMQRDEKRIQFNLDDEKMELQVFFPILVTHDFNDDITMIPYYVHFISINYLTL